MASSEHKQALRVGYEIKGYRVVDVLGVGGFGVTYLAVHQTLGDKVALKEYLPNEFAIREGTTVYPKSEADREDFEWGLARFLDEAKTLARFRHRNLVRVRDYFEANSTAYIVMDYEDGESLDRLLERHGTLSESQLRRILLPIIEGLKEVHEAGYLHRDIKPSNVYVRRSDESPVLLDFGAARQALGQKSKSLTAVASAGYSPPEQYESEGEQGPWTDIYALSALCYRAITGDPPIEAPRRQSQLLRGKSDPLPSLANHSKANGYSHSFLTAIDLGLRVIEQERPVSLGDWLASMQGGLDGVRDRTTGPPAIPSEKDASIAKSRPNKLWPVVVGALALVAVALAYWFTPIGDVVTEFRGKEDPNPAPTLQEPTPAELATGSREQGVPPKPAQVEDDVRPSMDLPGGRDSKPEPISILGGSALLVVETDPPGAEVMIGDQAVGETPLERSDITAGTYDVTLRHPSYQTVRLPERVFMEDEVLRIQETLVPGVGKLTVLTQPRDAWIERDGVRLAQGTPVTLDGLPAGLVELTLGADEHRSIRVEVGVPKNGVARLERSLERIPYGTLTLDLIPSDASVTLPDVVPAYQPGVRLPEGEQRVMVSRAGYRDLLRTVTVAGDTRVSIELVLNPQPFTVTTTPANAQVRLLDVAEAYRDGVPLEPGEYGIQVSATEYETHEETVTHGTQPTRHAVSLTRRPQPFTIVAMPPAARVRFVGSSQAYVAGMRLAPGTYRVHVSASGYEPWEETVRHGAEPTQHAVRLSIAIPPPGGTFAERLDSGGLGPEMVVIPAGSFRMGCVSGLDCADDKKPVHTVRISRSFALSKYEVTFSDWEACVRDGDCRGYRPDDKGWGLGNRPVINVSWEDAQSYVSWLSRETGEAYRLPSEAEWEYAARAGSTTKYSWGNDIGRNRANCDGCGSPWDASQTAPVGSFGANAFGLHDMHGNVWEWVEDCWNGSYSGAPSDGSAWLRGNCERRVLRGGSWNRSLRFLRSADRSRSAAGLRYSGSGFRVARTLTP